MSFCPAFVSSGPQRIMENLRVQCIPMQLFQNINVIEISHAGVGGSSGNDRFQLFGQNRFQIVRPNINGAIFQHQLERVADLPGGNGIPCGNVNLQRRHHTVKGCSHIYANPRIFRLIHNLRNTFQLEFDAIIKRDTHNSGNQILYVLHIDIGSFYSSVQIHRGTGIQTNHSRYQHTAFQNKFVTIFRKGDTLQKTLHHVVPHQELGVRRFFSGKIADQILQLPCCFYHKSTSKYCRRIFSTRNIPAYRINVRRSLSFLLAYIFNAP